jgi:hypothetical protein
MNQEIKKAIKAFYQVRNIPYVLGLDGDPNKLMSDNKGNCTRKDLYLANQLEELGFDVILGIASFSWAELPIPQAFVDLLASPIDSHMFLYASHKSKNNQLTRIDPTWDPGLRKKKFPINDWDGVSSTPLGVKDHSIRTENLKLFWTKSAIRKIVNDLRILNGNKPKPTPFNDAVNNWLGRSN